MTYTVQLLLKDGRSITSPRFADKATAESELKEIKEELRYHSPLERPWVTIQDALGTVSAASIVEDRSRTASFA